MNSIYLAWIEHITVGHARSGKNAARKKEALTLRKEKRKRPRQFSYVVRTINLADDCSHGPSQGTAELRIDEKPSHKKPKGIKPDTLYGLKYLFLDS